MRAKLLANRGRSFNHLVSERKQRGRHVDAKRPRGLEIDDQLEFGRLYDRQIRWLFPFENPSHIDPALTIAVRKTRTVAEQSARGDEFSLEINHWHGVPCRKGDKLIPSGAIERILTEDQRINLLLLEG